MICYHNVNSTDSTDCRLVAPNPKEENILYLPIYVDETYEALQQTSHLTDLTHPSSTPMLHQLLYYHTSNTSYSW